MILILVKILYLIFIINNNVINALPINNNASGLHNSTINFKRKFLPLENPINQFQIESRRSLTLPKFEVPKNFNLSKIVQNLKEFGIHSLKDDKHIEGLPLDRRGRINPEFHKEIFLGNHELFETDIQVNQQKRSSKLKEIFNDADVNRDQYLTKDELVSYVFQNIQQHLKEAKDKNARLFVLIDTNNDGKITWQEYSALYIKFHNLNSTNLQDLNEINLIDSKFDSDLQEELLKIRYRWTEADTDGDNELNMDQFLALRHPEIAGHPRKHMVDDIMERLDINNDEKLNETEFVFLPSSVLDDENNKEWIEMDKRWLEEQRKEFHEMDENHDKILTREELLKAYDPINHGHVNNQVKQLFLKVDDSPKDDLLSLEEIQNHADVFTDMRILDTEKILHDEV